MYTRSKFHHFHITYIISSHQNFFPFFISRNDFIDTCKISVTIWFPVGITESILFQFSANCISFPVPEVLLNLRRQILVIYLRTYIFTWLMENRKIERIRAVIRSYIRWDVEWKGIWCYNVILIWDTYRNDARRFLKYY